MTEEFKQFDKAPIIPIVTFNRWSFGLREVILAVIAGILLVMCLTFAGLFGNTNEKLANVPSASAIVGKRYCTDLGCLKTATRAVSLMNKSVDPCENFYQFACGNYKKVIPVLPNQGGRNVIKDLREVNEDRIIDVMEQPISALHDYAAERKLKKFFTSCNDMYSREKQRGLPILTSIIPALGGWKLLGTWDPATWDLNSAVKKVQSDFWVDALYAPRIAMDRSDGEKRIISLAAAGTGKYMQPWWYTSTYYSKVKEDYKKFIRRVGSLILRDAATLLDPPQGNATESEGLLEEFVNDTFTMESQIASLDQLGYDAWDDELYTKMSLGALTTETNNVIDWTGQLSYLFNTAGISASTKIDVTNMEYFTGLSEYLSSLPQLEMKRMLHNYLIWRVLESYVQEMSWEYIHANREIYVDLFGRAQFLGVYRYCFYLSEFYMGDALGHLYITQFLSKENKDTAHEISDNIRLALQSQISKTPWMDEPTRQYALEKLQLLDLKIGFPDWLANQGEIDDMYSSLIVNASDFFGNVIRMNQFRRAFWNADLRRRGTGHEEWTHAVYETTASFSMLWNEVAVPAGLLQFPIYDASQPHSSSFGSLGSIMGMFVHRFVDEWGKFTDKNGQIIGSGPGTWWSNSTVNNYKVVKQCVKEAYSNLTRTVLHPDDQWREVKVNASYAASSGIAWVNGVKLALLAYHDWSAAKSLDERLVPGLDMTYDQMLFLAHAQTACEVEDRWTAYMSAVYDGMDAELNVNTALGQLEEFSRAFQCKKQAKMNHAKKCQYY
ncbi:hypothetical protein EGW08_013335 [Elysia chlorotica]|uniref:Peptidase M13 N-terminal domain-containing protein n=1 Tax=Elysia chlorotica TaxID=188477 RepID=A0A3S0ZZB4_ELYCH|nr:hypothetical protein EGW08_013335 [Elysia chlorotica]